MGMEKMGVRVELWTLAADRAIWLRGGDADRSSDVMSDGDLHAEVRRMLGDDDADTAAIHSTSWRPDGPSVLHTFVAVVDVDGRVLDRWPDAHPVGVPLADAVGRPLPHAADEPPTPRDVDVLFHALRHLAFLRLTDDTLRAALPDVWLRHLAPLRPTLATLYKAA